ncbi:hypothetical protein L1987_42987 [Smallanthus sonchifolius]|uniref:Uncharacterized protein n=1 Tax=Smallanthus sonchifolius TaxID=185202 RepID=A0ACB9GL47_9ASTR|nr:hypothetical protein L1987_42987 [Smallanthus sonchifolius]
MWRLLSDENIAHLHHQSICLEGVSKIVSNKDAFLIALARAEMVDNIRVLAKSISHLSKRCEDSSLSRFETAFEVFANTQHESDHDPYESFDDVTSLLATSIFTILSRIKLVFGIKSSELEENYNEIEISHGFFETNSKMLKPASNTLGYAGLSLHYDNLIIVMEKMIRSPQLVGLDARDDLYLMLPNSVRSTLSGRLKGIGLTASDPVLAGEWREALGMILGWLSPLAHNMIKWQNERSFEHQNLVPKTNVLLLQTLFFANRTS